MSEITTDDLRAIISAQSFETHSEAALQLGISKVLSSRDIAHAREFRLSPADRIDFMVGRIGVEVKIGGSRVALIRQLHRYAQSDEIDELLVVTTAPNLMPLPSHFNDKLIRSLVLSACLI